ncbi:hypothetical protein LWI28_004008 [Acer negundo]|uniref:Gag-pol polyprotein n=1 Tax=Acer negundo TaxID=4023 RepID=A0AAD5NYG2_ACENE|nr:hypothetical protein LWI28_004008 [Acer negundo]
MARVMLLSNKVLRNLWAEAINMACYIGNRVFLRPETKQTSYELWKGRKPNESGETSSGVESNQYEKDDLPLNRVPPLDSNEPAPWVRKLRDKDDIIGDVREGVRTRRQIANQISYTCYTTRIKSKKVDESLEDEFWVLAMQEQLNQFERNEVWTLVPRPRNINVIGTKWVFRNKSDEDGNIVRNKARLVA